jgi:hypothetical protein
MYSFMQAPDRTGDELSIAGIAGDRRRGASGGIR